ncbi:tryptophan-rich sensory protein [Anoxybacterium hadale]|uniref:Tryptophan-rich sensory protein n=1 Tax=Anoxybacterium hadale TaxID=3408580 RepID=A0ACD1AE16_9FIRM|nr:tryptophan-rich sensory protein [Clostridiales bacterium]
MKNIKALILSVLISVGVGALAGYLTMDSMQAYDAVAKPDLVPPNWVFPIVWTILYILMGISAYLVYVSDSSYRNQALRIYAIQLVMNFFWSIIFFNLQMYLLAFIWLLLLLGMIVLMIVSFYQVNKTAAYLQIPYLIWVLFAGYLNLSIYLMNR